MILPADSSFQSWFCLRIWNRLCLSLLWKGHRIDTVLCHINYVSYSMKFKLWTILYGEQSGHIGFNNNLQLLCGWEKGLFENFALNILPIGSGINLRSPLIRLIDYQGQRILSSRPTDNFSLSIRHLSVNLFVCRIYRIADVKNLQKWPITKKALDAVLWVDLIMILLRIRNFFGVDFKIFK